MTSLDIAAAAVRLYAESHPRPPHVTQAQAAEMLGVHRHTVASLIRAGTIKLNKCGLIPTHEIDRVIAANSP